MKRNTIIWFFNLLLLQGTLLSCNDWLEVNPNAEVTEERLFGDYEGFRTAVNGVYRLLGGKSLYGQQLTWGVASVLGNNYDAASLPGYTSGNSLNYRLLAAGDYQSPYSTALVDPIWLEGYRVIANCNNVLSGLSSKDTTFFPQGKVERDLIRGEILGVRAMVHLDLIRLFAPSTKADDGRLYLPYVTVFPDRGPQHLTCSQALESVIADLKESRTLLAHYDTISGTAAIRSVGARMESVSSSLAGGLFFGYRGLRMNYVAATALLARAYQWRNEPGDAEEAYRCASNAHRFAGTPNNWYPFTSSFYLNSAQVGNIHRKMHSDILFAAYNANMYDILTEAIDGYYFFYYKNVSGLDDIFLNPLGGSDSDDFRKTALINTSSDGTNMNNTSRRWSRPTVVSAMATNVATYQGPLAPVIRMSEVYYILCEYLSGAHLSGSQTVDLPRAITLLGQVRLARGAKLTIPSTISKEDFLKLLYIDMTREFMSEGQTFFLYKRLNQPIFNGAFPMDMTGRYVLPAPYSETAYINL